MERNPKTLLLRDRCSGHARGTISRALTTLVVGAAVSSSRCERFEITLGLEIGAIRLPPTCIYVHRNIIRDKQWTNFLLGDAAGCGEYRAVVKNDKLDGEQ